MREQTTVTGVAVTGTGQGFAFRSTASPSIPRSTFRGQLLDNGKRLLGVGIARHSTDRRGDLVVGRDDESRTFRHAMADLVATGILHFGDGLSVIGVRD